MTKVLYKKGYLIRVHSWENDADHYNNKEVQVETEQEAKDIIAYCNLFKSSVWEKKGGIGNIYEVRESDWDRVNEILKVFYEGHRELFPEPCENNDEICEYLIDYGYDLGLTSGEQFSRYCERVEILYFPEDVICEEVKF